MWDLIDKIELMFYKKPSVYVIIIALMLFLYVWFKVQNG